MIIIAWILWVAMWGASGYFTVRAIQNHIEYRRAVKRINAYQELLGEVDRALHGES